MPLVLVLELLQEWGITMIAVIMLHIIYAHFGFHLLRSLSRIDAASGSLGFDDILLLDEDARICTKVGDWGH